jgi:phospholipid/cholesterol/gamma-HCH transport system permease protein
MRTALQYVGDATLGLLADSGEIWRLALTAGHRLLREPFRRGVRFGETMYQTVRAGTGSVPLVALLCTLVGMIMALQGAYQLEKMGATSMVAGLVAVSVTRELAPLLAAIIVTGRVGSAFAAELATMQVSQEVDALTVMGIDPVSFLVVPRLSGLVIALPCLTLLADVVAIVGGMLIGVSVLGMGAPGYVSLTLDSLVLQDVYTGLVKAVVFALIIGLVACHRGLTTRGGAEEVGRSTTASVVRSIVLIILADLLVTALFFARG